MVATITIAAVAAAVVLSISALPHVSTPLRLLDNVMYDSFYKARPVEDRNNSEVVIVAVDDKSLDDVNAKLKWGWPWPRKMWGLVIQFAERAGAKAVVFDIMFSQSSVWNGNTDPRFFALFKQLPGPKESDDETLGATVDAAHIPVVFASLVHEDGTYEIFAPKVTKPILAEVNFTGEEVTRSYAPTLAGKPSLALQAVQSVGLKSRLNDVTPFLMRYYGPSQTADGKRTFRTLSVINLIAAATDNNLPKHGLDPAWFKDKIVVVATTSAGTYDLKNTPLSNRTPGTELHVTAIENMLNGQEVRTIAHAWQVLATVIVAFIGAAVATFPRKVAVKLGLGVVTFAIAVAVPLYLFHGKTIYWLPPAAPLVASMVAVFGAMGWSYLAEDRQRRFLMKALSQYVSPTVAAEIEKDPSKLKLGGERREMTVMFTDIAGFTDLSEKLDAERVSTMLNYYLDAMTGILFSTDGTVDKYIGDAIMTFWNAPIQQDDHAIRACRAAVAMRDRERQIQAELTQLGGGSHVFTRIGVNSGPMSVGNMGSSTRMAYTVLGDSVNLGSRLESINKQYGTTILISQSTAALVDTHFLKRHVDRIKVKGKKIGIDIFELIADGPGTAEQQGLVAKYHAAIERYFSKDWDSTEKILLEILAQFPDDGPSKTLMSHVEYYRHEAPPSDWDGAWVFKDK